MARLPDTERHRADQDLAVEHLRIVSKYQPERGTDDGQKKLNLDAGRTPHGVVCKTLQIDGAGSEPAKRAYIGYSGDPRIVKGGNRKGTGNRYPIPMGLVFLNSMIFGSGYSKTFPS